MDSVRIKNARVVTKMNILAYSVSEIWRFYLFCGVWGPILAPLEPNLGIFETITNGFCGVEIGGIGTKMSILALLVSEIW